MLGRILKNIYDAFTVKTNNFTSTLINPVDKSRRVKIELEDNLIKLDQAVINIETSRLTTFKKLERARSKGIDIRERIKRVDTEDPEAVEKMTRALATNNALQKALEGNYETQKHVSKKLKQERDNLKTMFEVAEVSLDIAVNNYEASKGIRNATRGLLGPNSNSLSSTFKELVNDSDKHFAETEALLSENSLTNRGLEEVSGFIDIGFAKEEFLQLTSGGSNG